MKLPRNEWLHFLFLLRSLSPSHRCRLWRGEGGEPRLNRGPLFVLHTWWFDQRFFAFLVELWIFLDKIYFKRLNRLAFKKPGDNFVARFSAEWDRWGMNQLRKIKQLYVGEGANLQKPFFTCLPWQLNPWKNDYFSHWKKDLAKEQVEKIKAESHIKADEFSQT